MQLLSNEKIKDFRSIIGDFSNYRERYEQLISGIFRGTFLQDLFAQPHFREGKGEISWYSPIKGTAYKFEELQDAEKNEILDILSKAKEENKKLVQNLNQKDREYYSKIFEIPSLSNVCIIRNESGIHPVITMWGSISANDPSGKGIIERLVRRRKPKEVDIYARLSDEEGEWLPNIEIGLVTDEGERRTAKTSKNGIAQFGKLRKGKTFSLTVKSFELEETFTADGHTDNGGFYELTKPEEAPIPEIVVYTLTLQDKKGNPIPEQPFVLTSSVAEQNLSTDAEGKANFEGPSGEEKIEFTAEYEKKNFKKELDFIPEQTAYTLTLKKRNLRPLLYLLLGLLLLLAILLFPCSHNIDLKAVNSIDQLEIENANVAVEYFYLDDTPLGHDTITNEKGNATLVLEKNPARFGSFFENKEPLYSKLFFPYPQGKIFLTHACHEEKIIEIQPLSKWKRNTIELDPVMLRDVQFVVKDAETRYPIPYAVVTIQSIYNGNTQQTIIDTTRFGGTIVIPEIPLCSKIKVSATKKYHSTDTIGWIELREVMDSLEQRTLYLKSMVQQQTFFVRSTSNKRGLPGALVEAHIELNNAIIDTIRTVAAMDGSVQVPIPKSNGSIFMQGELLGYHDSIYVKGVAQILKHRKVRDSITLWLRPKPFEMTLTVLDSFTMAPIASAQVQLRCDKVPTSGGLTDGNGEVFLGGTRIDCQIELDVSHPKYYPKTKTGALNFFQADPKNRIVYLRPKPPNNQTPLDCGGKKNHKDRLPKDATYYLKSNSGTFTFDYNTDSKSDKIEIFNSNGQPLWDFEGATGTWRQEEITFDTPYLNVKVTGSSIWYYVVNCPD